LTILEIIIAATIFDLFLRGLEKSKRNLVDLCITVYKNRGEDHLGGVVGQLVRNGKRAVQSFVEANCLLKPGVYLIFTMAFNHWSSGIISVLFTYWSIQATGATSNRGGERHEW